MKDKRLAVCLVIFVFLVLIIVLGSTIFALESVNLNMLDNSTLFTGQENEIIENANFNYGSNVLFLGKKKYVEKLEKQNPYIKILNIETIFPNKLRINAVSRTEIFAVKQKDSSYAIIDEDGKVLKVERDFISSQSNAILLEGVEEFATLSKGDFLSFTKRQKGLFQDTFNSFKEWKIETSELQLKIKSLTLDYERQNQVKVQMFSGAEIVIKDANEYNSDKFNHVFSVYDSDIKYQENCILEVRLSKNLQTGKYELRVYYNGNIDWLWINKDFNNAKSG